jgi:hypothetical protein
MGYDHGRGINGLCILNRARPKREEKSVLWLLKFGSVKR